LCYFNEIQSKKGTQAIDYLIHQEDTYEYIYQLLRSIDKYKKLRVLEVGSGLGYFTYALSQDGFNILGVDLSADAVKKSTKAFGNLYKSGYSKDLGETFDIIISINVIQHVTSPVDFILDLKKLLKSEGKILLATYRKYDEQDKSLWLTELPPIHLFWFTTKSLELIGKKTGLEFFEIDLMKDTKVSNSITNASPTLSNKLEPIMKNKRIYHIKSKILDYSPIFFTRFYYKLVKRSKFLISTKHYLVFFVLKN